MKKAYYIICFATMLIAAGCREHVPTEEQLPQDAVDFTYEVVGDTYTLDYYVGSTIKFYPTIALSTDCEWDFGDGSEKVVGDTVIHKFTLYGTFKVTAKANGWQKTNPLYISDIKPIVTIIQSDSLCEVNQSLVSFSVELPNPDNLEAVYTWTFPEGTTNESGTVVSSFTGTDKELGKVKFARVGSQSVSLQVSLGGRNLELVKKNVQVALNTEAPTVYYAVKEGNIMARKLYKGTDVAIDPYDLGISAGQHMFTILFYDDNLYLLDAGTQFNYVNDEDRVLGDGKISVMSKDGTSMATMISNVGGYAFDDPFYGCIYDGKLYYSDRNTGIIVADINTRNQSFSNAAFPYYVQNNYLGYYNRGLAYGAITSSFIRVNDLWYWGKTYNGQGIWRFAESDILQTAVTTENTPPAPDAGAVLKTFYPKSMAYNEKTGDFFFTIYDSGAGFYKCKIEDLDGIKDVGDLTPFKKVFADGKDVEAVIAAGKGEGSSGEFIGITELAIDYATDDVYFGYRTDEGVTSAESALIKYNAETDKLEYVVQGVQIYGVCINNEPSKLF